MSLKPARIHNGTAQQQHANNDKKECVHNNYHNAPAHSSVSGQRHTHLLVKMITGAILKTEVIKCHV